MNRNVSIIMVVLVLVVIAGYLVWIRSKVQETAVPRTEEQVQATPAVTPNIVASSAATPVAKEATGSAKLKSATPSSTKK